MTKGIQFLSIILFLILITMTAESCKNSTIYSKKVNIPDSWVYQDTVDFSFEISDTINLFDFVLHIQHGDDFPYQNLYVWAITDFPNNTSSDQQLSLQLTSENGQWVGKCGENMCTAIIPIATSIKFKEQGLYGLKLSQYSRNPKLSGVHSIQFDIVHHPDK